MEGKTEILRAIEGLEEGYRKAILKVEEAWTLNMAVQVQKNMQSEETIKKLKTMFGVQIKKQLELEKKQSESEKTIQLLEERLEEIQKQNTQQSEEMKVCKKDADRATAFEKSHNVIISGIEECPDETHEILASKINKFVRKELQLVEVIIDTARRIGKPENNNMRKIVVTCNKIGDQKLILSKKTDLRKRNGRPIYIDPDYTKEISRKKFEEREVRRKERKHNLQALHGKQSWTTASDDLNWRSGQLNEKDQYPVFHTTVHTILTPEQINRRERDRKGNT